METNANPLIEFFYLFGISSQTLKNSEHFKENNFLKPEFLKPELLSKFPPVIKPYAEIEPSIIISHCFPKGFKLVESISVPREEILHFSIDNVPSRHSKNKYIYFTCLIFYESLITYYNIQKFLNHDSPESNSSNNLNKIKIKKQRFEKKSNTNVVINKSYLFDNFYIPKVLCFSSFIPFPSEFQYLLKKIKEYSLGEMGKISIPVEKIIESLVITVPRPILGRFNLKIKKDYFLLNGDKSDLDISLRDFNQYNFHSYRYQLIFIFSVENIIEIYKSLLLEIPLLFFSNDKDKLTNIVHTFLELLSPFKYQYPFASILPEDNLGIIEHAKSFVFGINQEWINAENGENFFMRKNILMINKPIRICDIDKQKLDLYYNKKDAESVITFEELEKLNNNSENNNTNCNEANNISTNTDVNNANLTINKANEYNYNLIGYQLPLHYGEKLKKSLNNFLKEKFGYNEYDPKINQRIGEEIFYYFLVSIFQNYNQFLYNTEKEVESINEEIFMKNVYNIPIEKIFKINDFLYDNRREDREFFSAFLNTNIFRNFLSRKYMNSEVDKYLFLHFDETILSKKNRKLFNKKAGIQFIGPKRMETKSWYVVNKSNNPPNFNKAEIKIIKEKKKFLFQYFQIFNEKDYKYYLFPILLYDNTFFNNEPYKIINYFSFNNINLKSCLSESSSLLNILQDTKLLSKYNSDILVQFKHNPAKSIYPKEIENSIYLLWLKIFCMTFYYCDQNEKYLRFYEMLKVVRKLFYIKDNILSLILSALEKYGDEYMIIEFFDYIKHFTYGDYAYLVNKLLNPKRTRGKNIILKKVPISNTGLILYYYKDNKEQHFSIPLFDTNLSKKVKKRTFLKNDNKNITLENKEIIRFDNCITCHICGKNLDIAKLTLCFEEMNKFEKLTCYLCKKKIEPKIRVRIWENYFTITLYEPYFLYNNISSNLLRIYGNELNLDDLRDKNFDFLYNCCWYFNMKGISYDMMLKYKEEESNVKPNELKIYNRKKRKARFSSLEIEKTNE